MTVVIEYADSEFKLVFINQGNASRKIWEFHNSWGWNTLTWILTENDKRTKTIEIKKLRNKAWTKNGPSFFEIPAGSRYVVPINLKDSDWEIPDEVNTLKDKALIIKISLEIPRSPESEMYDVFVGKLDSNEILLNPPHNWLPAK